MMFPISDCRQNEYRHGCFETNDKHQRHAHLLLGFTHAHTHVWFIVRISFPSVVLLRRVVLYSGRSKDEREQYFYILQMVITDNKLVVVYDISMLLFK